MKQVSRLIEILTSLYRKSLHDRPTFRLRGIRHSVKHIGLCVSITVAYTRTNKRSWSNRTKLVIKTLPADFLIQLKLVFINRPFCILMWVFIYFIQKARAAALFTQWRNPESATAHMLTDRYYPAQSCLYKVNSLILSTAIFSFPPHPKQNK